MRIEALKSMISSIVMNVKCAEEEKLRLLSIVKLAVTADLSVKKENTNALKTLHRVNVPYVLKFLNIR
jgi:hypothetical protein